MSPRKANKPFQEVAQADPLCAMAQWGLAMTEWRPLWDGMPEEVMLERGISVEHSTEHR